MDDSDSGIQIPKHELTSLARCLLPDIIAFFESPEGQKEFEEWQRKNNSNKK